MKTIHLARGLTLPAAELATEVVASLGNRGSGKTNGAAVVAEGLLAASVQLIVLDYVGNWFSLRLAEDGKRASPFEIPVLGGRHGDIALMASTGHVIAETLARTRSSAVLDLSGFSKIDRCRFATDFAETFFRTKQTYPGPVQLLLEESQRFIPQKLFTGMERMLGAFEEIAEVGRNYGIGLHLISQRPQKINKDVLNLADTVFAYRTNGVLERKAISDWVQEKDAEGRKDVHDELPGIPRGSAIVWSPPRRVYGQFALHKRSTYDAGATPIHQRAAVKTRKLDLAALEATMGASVEEAKANDPRILKARISELERELSGAKRSGLSAKRNTVDCANSSSQAKAAAALKKTAKQLEQATDKLYDAEQKFVHSLKEKQKREAVLTDTLSQRQQVVVSELGNVRTLLMNSAKMEPAPAHAKRESLSPSVNNAKREVQANDLIPSLSRCARALLGVLAQRGVATDSQLSIMSGYRKTSSGFANSLSELRTSGLMQGTPDRREITEVGRAAAGPSEPLPTGPHLLDYWVRRLSRSEGTLLGVIYSSETITRKALSEKSGYSITSSGFVNAISALRLLDEHRYQ